MSLEIPGYKILRILGKGGMATVYLAIQEVFEREVALKVMSKALAEDPNFGQRFFREAKIVSKLVHPNIVTVHDVGKHDGYLYLSMEYIDGHDLRFKLSQLNLRQKIQVVRDIAKALDYAGSKGYVHRDIKPENIMFHSSDDRAVLMDFGIARAAETKTTVTQTGTAIGTPHYMSPEQAKGKTVDCRSDIYSLGVVLYLMLAGRVPYDAESAVAIGIKHITEPVPLLPPQYKGVQPLLDSMMAKEVSQRYQNARELMHDLDLLDITVLEHSEQMMQQGAWKDGDPHATAVFTHASDGHAEDFEIPENERTPFDTFALYEQENTQVREGFSIFPWAVSLIFVLSVVVGFLYVKEPELVGSWIAVVKEQGHQLTGMFINEEPRVLDEEKVKAREQAQRKLAQEKSPQRQERTEAPTNTTTGNIVREVQNSSVIASSATQAPEITPAPVDAKPPNTVTVAELNARIERLAGMVERDAVYLPELVQSYQQLLSLEPHNQDAQNAYGALRSEKLQDAKDAAEKLGASAALNKKLTQIQSLFPEVSQKEIDDIAQAGKTRKKVLSLILEAEAYLNQNNLTQPSGRNALDVYEKVLELDKDNEAALEGKKNISNKLVKLAEKRYSDGDLEAAVKTLDKSLQIYPANRDAQKLREHIVAKLSHDEKIKNLLASAARKIKEEQLFSPKGEGAYYDYQEVLRLEPNNQKARRGQEEVIDALSAKVWKLVGEKKTTEVKAVLRVPLAELPEHERVRSLALAVEEMIGEKVMVSNP